MRQIVLVFMVSLALAWGPPISAAEVSPGLSAAKAAFDAKDYKRAYELYWPLAVAGDPEAMHQVGWLFSEGLGVAQDFAQARLWYQGAVRLGHSRAMLKLARLYRDGLGGVSSDYESFKLTRRAAQLGNRLAQYNLAVHFDREIGTDRDPDAMLCWLFRAANQGDAEAMVYLFGQYFYGFDVKINVAEAYFWALLGIRHWRDLDWKGRMIVLAEFVVSWLRLTWTEKQSIGESVERWRPISEEGSGDIFASC